MFDINVHLVDDNDDLNRTLKIMRDGERVDVHAHVSLAADEVRVACKELGELREPVFTAWATHVGFQED